MLNLVAFSRSQMRGLTRVYTQPLFKRFKSDFTNFSDDFPYQLLDQIDSSKLSSMFGPKLPMSSFLAQHMPLMPFSRPSKQGTKFVNVIKDSNHTPFAPDQIQVIPQEIAQQIRPFNKDLVLKSGKAPKARENLAPEPEPIMDYLKNIGEVHIIPLKMQKQAKAQVSAKSKNLNTPKRKSNKSGKPRKHSKKPRHKSKRGKSGKSED